jgi:tetratricopeptide (TPR) repeat protein
MLRPRTSLHGALVCAALLAFVSGCSVIHLGHSSPSDDMTAATIDAKPTGKKGHEKQADAAALDPLSEAQLRAQEQPSEPWWPYQVATLEAKAGRSAEAEASLRAAVARDSGYAPALTALSRTLYEQGRHEEAIRMLAPVREGRVTLSDDDRATLLAGLALHEAALGRDADARETASSLPRDQAAGVRAYLAVRDTNRNEADKATASALKDAPSSAAFHNNRGIALLRAADADAAEKEFLRAIEIDPARAAPYYNLAILERWYRQDATAAATRFKQYWRLSHADPDSLYAELGHGPATVAEGGTSK